jgi:DNA-binding NtrC family response regulator
MLHFKSLASPAMPISPTITVLVVEDEPGQARLIEMALAASKTLSFSCVQAETLAEACELLVPGDIDVVLLDLTLPDSVGAATLQKLHLQFPSVPIVVLTGIENEELGIQLVQAGAQDYVPKGQVTPPLLHRSLRFAIERQHALLERERLLDELKLALAEVKTLSGLIPICASCKKVRDDTGYWNQVENFISDRSGAKFSHSICPNCAKVLYPGINIYPEDPEPPPQ